MQFRYDINGLRAIAVLAVVIFHFNPQWLPGGFAGVDVFFVISGFLMTSIIFSNVEKNSFNLFKFYNARANRIIPVLAAMSAVLLIFGWFYLLPSDYSNLARQIERSSLFISNLIFAKDGGYFDTAENTKWLLHTWSLSVEWQFYIFFPIIIIALKKYLSLNNLKRVVIGLFVASFIYCIYSTYKDSKIAYFMLTTRAWEMLLGGLAFLYPWSLQSKIKQVTIQSFGILLIFAAYFLMSKDTLWPSYMALIPVFGAYLIIVSNYQNNVIINNSIFNYIGKWSYSIYVWHWPLVVFGAYFVIDHWWIFGIPLSILIGFLSYQIIEKINFLRYSSWKKIYKVKPFYIFLLILFCGYAVKKMDGFPQKLPHDYQEKVHLISMPTHRDNWCFYDFNDDSSLQTKTINAQSCLMGQSNAKQKALLFGDSFAGHNTPFWDKIGRKLQISINGISTNWCYPSLNDDYTGPKTKVSYQQCLLNRQYLKEHYNEYDYIILAGMWTSVMDKGQLDNLKDLMNFLSLHNKKIIIMDEPYFFDLDIGNMYKRNVYLHQEFDIKKYLKNSRKQDQLMVSEKIRTMIQNKDHVLFINRKDLFDKSYMTKDRVPYSLEGIHLSTHGSIASAEYFQNQNKFTELQKFLK